THTTTAHARQLEVVCQTRPDPRHLHSFPTRRSSDLLLRTKPEQLPPPVHGAPYAIVERLRGSAQAAVEGEKPAPGVGSDPSFILDRKSTRLNSSHVKNSYAVFCWQTKRPQPNHRPRC